jgi:phosphate transport system substrate-binding protein
MSRRPKLLIVLAAIGVLAAACSKSTTTGGASPSGTASSSPTAGGGGSITPAAQITGAGSTFAAPLYQDWSTKFQPIGHVQVSYTGTGSGAGITAIIQKTLDFAGTDAPMNPTQTAQAPAPMVHIPTALGAVVVMYNLPTYKTPLKLSGQTLADIFQRKVTTWNAPEIAADNPGAKLPSTPIVVVHRSDSSGTTSIFTNYLSMVSPAWKSGIGAGTVVPWPAGELGGAGSAAVAASVQQTPGAVGYVELTYALKNNIAAASIQNADKSAFVAPSVTSTTAAAAGVQPSVADNGLVFTMLNQPGSGTYPISGPTYVLVYKAQTDGPKGQAVVNFLYWGLTSGQADEGPLGYAPLPDNIKSASIQVLNSVTFNGKPLHSGI